MTVEVTRSSMAWMWECQERVGGLACAGRFPGQVSRPEPGRHWRKALCRGGWAGVHAAEEGINLPPNF